MKEKLKLISEVDNEGGVGEKGVIVMWEGTVTGKFPRSSREVVKSCRSGPASRRWSAANPYVPTVTLRMAGKT